MSISRSTIYAYIGIVAYMAPSEIAELVFKYLRAANISETELARRIGIPQPTLRRSLRHGKRLTSTHRRICKYVGIALDVVEPHRAGMKERLASAIVQLWDGSNEHGSALLALMQAADQLGSAGASQATVPPLRVRD